MLEKKEPGRLTEIDLLRFMAAFSVLLFHYTFRGKAADNLSTVNWPALASFFKYGYLGVDLFFIISGFVILLSAADKSPKDFAISRMVRLYPAFWICCTLTFVLSVLVGTLPLIPSFKDYAVNMTMLGLFSKATYIDGVYWSLAIEIKFYLLVGLLILLKQMKQIKCFLIFWLAASGFLSFWPIPGFSVLLLHGYSPYFISGAVFFLMEKGERTFFTWFLLAGSYGLALFQAHQYMQEITDHYQTQFDFAVIAGLVSLFYLIFLGVVFNLTRFLRSDKLMVVGLMTYPLYLIHQFMGYMAFNAFSPYLDSRGLIVMVTIGALLIAFGISTWLEKPPAKALKVFLKKLVFPQKTTRLIKGKT